MSKITVFLGGTCNNSTWRDELIAKLNEGIEAFNPVVADWNEEVQKVEDAHKAQDEYCLYVFTPESLNSPQRGLYSIAEVTDDSNKRGNRVLFAAINYGGQEFTAGELKGLKAVKKTIASNGAKVFESLDEIATYLDEGAIMYSQFTTKNDTKQ